MVVFRAEDQNQLQLMEREEMDDEDDLFEAIDKLINQGINAGDVKKLQDVGIYTCNGLMMFTKKHLIGIKGLSEAKVDKICEAAEKIVFTEDLYKLKEFQDMCHHYFLFCSDEEVLHFLHKCMVEMERLLTLILNRPDRIVPIAERFGMDPGAVLDNIIYARAYTYEHQYNLLFGLAAKMSEEPFRLLQKLAQMLSRLIKIDEEFNVAVYMTNQVIADPGGGVFISDPKKPAGGHVLAHAATIRLMFRKGKGEQRVCKVFDAPNLPEAETISLISIHVVLLYLLILV
ncbi:hypothetical protein DKX38_015421 [Salix brachista]|uniref:RecA family profile 2 domain-containing protein n=1 Tax=Salix brachista TaxID=2182728 RepID=A0A5N5L5U5_9ROSI|nr:hypothetical protein DKX38_015421 [Salix brachista]